MSDETYQLYKDPHLDPLFRCRQEAPIKHIADEVTNLADHVDERLARYELLLEKLAEAVRQIQVLSDRDSRRERDVDTLYERMRESEKDRSILRAEIERGDNDLKLKIENLVIKVGLLCAGVSLVIALGSQVMVSHFTAKLESINETKK